MRRLIQFIGVIITLIAIALFAVARTGDSVLTVIALEPFICEFDETLNTSVPDGFVCMDDNDQQRDVTETVVNQGIPILQGALIAALVVGFGLILLGRRPEPDPNPVESLNDFAEIYQQGQKVDLQSMNLNDANIPPQARAIMSEVLGQIGKAFDMGTLAERLQQLEEARQQGLITQAEYDRVRQAILDSMDD